MMKHRSSTLLLALLALPALASAQRARIEISERGWIGVRPYFEITVSDGKRSERLAVIDVVRDSPADRAGITPGDRILRINGRDANTRSLNELSRDLSPGDTVRLRLATGERERDVTLIAEAQPASTGMVARGPFPELYTGRDSVLTMARVFMDSALRVLRDTTFVYRFERGSPLIPRDSAVRMRITTEPGSRVFQFSTDGEPYFPKIEILGARSISGAEFTELNDGLAEYFGTREGLLVLRVGRGTPADRAGLEAGDVVTRADGRVIRSVSELRSMVIQARGESVRLEILRKGQKRTVEL